MTRSSGKGTRKRVTGGGVLYNPFTWGKETNDPIAQSTSIVPQNNTEIKQSEITPPNKTLYESIFGTNKPVEVKQDTTNQSTKPTTKPWYQFWGGKTRKSKSKNKNTRKSSK